MDLTNLITARETALIIGKADRTVRHWQLHKTKGKPQGVQIGGQWLFNRDEVMAYAAEARKKGK